MGISNGTLWLLPSVHRDRAAKRSAVPYRCAQSHAVVWETGTFSSDLFGPSAPKLQHASTGVGQAIATLVVVEITGPPDSYSPNRKVSLTATARTRSVLTITLTLGRLGDDGEFYAPFWLYDTGCTPVVLNIVGQLQEFVLQKTIDFIWKLNGPKVTLRLGGPRVRGFQAATLDAASYEANEPQ